ncbi:MAG: hypothetical protein ACP5I1_20130, partial [Candidatus Hinthialibacter sp.]
MKSRIGLMQLAMGAMLLLGFVGTAAWAETEPNNNASSANVVELNTSASGILNSVDSTDSIDFYKFTAPSDGYFQLGVSPQGDELDVEIWLKDADGMYPLGSKNAEGAGGAEGIVYPNMRAGDYYAVVKIPDAAAAMQGSYNATFSFLPVEEIDPEPNDATAQAAELTLNEEMTGHIGYYGNQHTDVRDFFLITLPQDGALELDVYPDGTANVGLHLYDGVIFNRINLSDKAGKGESEKIKRGNLRAGTYIVLVDRQEGYGSYNLTNLFTADAAPDNEPNDGVSEAIEINLTEGNPSAAVQGRLGYYGNQVQDDSDYLRISIPSYGAIAFQFAMDAGDGLSVDYQLWDSGLRRLGNGNSFDGLPAGVYYARLQRTGEGYGSYTLTVSHEAKEAPVPVAAPAAELPLNGQISNISISEEETEHWYAVNLPEDGSLSVTMQFEASAYVFMGLYDETGLTEYKKVYTYWTTDEKAIQIPNLLAGTYT